LKLSDDEKRAISKGSGISVGLISLMMFLLTVAWNGASYVFDYQATKKVVLALEAEIKDLRKGSSEKDAYHESLIQALNIKYDRKQDK